MILKLEDDKIVFKLQDEVITIDVQLIFINIWTSGFKNPL